MLNDTSQQGQCSTIYHMFEPLFQTNALTIDVVHGGGTAGQVQDTTVAAVHVMDDIATQRGIYV